MGISVHGAGSTRKRVATPLSKNQSAAEDELAFQLQCAHLPFERQVKIRPDRRFRADFYFRAHELVVEVDGGGFIEGRHSRGKGMERDAEKSFYIALMPARLIRVTPRHVRDGRALKWIQEAL
jgi:very-short-patch-repair endonuclease